MKSTFGEFLAERRKAQGLTQKELANKIFVSESAVSKWEQNRANPDITIIPTLAEILGVSEHELITASIDNNQRETTRDAKKWRKLKFSWNLFFVASYLIAILTCFICNLATSGGLDWFWIVASGVLLSATFTTLPQYVKKFKLLILSFSQLLSLIILLAVVCVYSGGNWFWVAVFPSIVGFVLVFLPIFINTYNFPKVIKKHNALFCVLIDFALLVGLIYLIENFVISNGYSATYWATNIALPILSVCGAMALLFVLNFRYLTFNKLIKTGTMFLILTFSYPCLMVVIKNVVFNVFGIEENISFIPNFALWIGDSINNNVNFLIVLTHLCLCAVFLTFGIIKELKKKK